MIKLLYIPTGNMFTLPDEEATRIIKQDRGNYKVLEGGIIEPEEPKQVDEKTVKELVMPEVEEDEEETEQEAEPEKPVEKFTKEEVNKLTIPELLRIIKAYGGTANRRDGKNTLIEKAYKVLGL